MGSQCPLCAPRFSPKTGCRCTVCNSEEQWPHAALEWLERGQGGRGGKGEGEGGGGAWRLGQEYEASSREGGGGDMREGVGARGTRVVTGEAGKIGRVPV